MPRNCSFCTRILICQGLLEVPNEHMDKSIAISINPEELGNVNEKLNPNQVTSKKLAISSPGAFYGTFLLNGSPGAFFGTFNN